MPEKILGTVLALTSTDPESRIAGMPTDRPELHTENTSVWLEGPDLVCIRGRGEISDKDMSETAAFYDQHIRNWPQVFVMADQREQTGMTAEARKVAARVFTWVPFRGTVFYGGSFAMRTVGKMIMTIMNSLRKHDNPIMFVKTEEEARGWIEERRRELAAKG